MNMARRFCNVLCLPLFRFGMIYYDVTIIYVYKRPIFNGMYAHIRRMIFFNHPVGIMNLS